MKILIVWIMLYELRIAESSAQHRRLPPPPPPPPSPPSQQQQQQPRDEPVSLANRGAVEKNELPNHRWIWTGNTDGLLLFASEPLPEQRKRIATAVAASAVTAIAAANGNNENDDDDDDGSGELDHPWMRFPIKPTCFCESQSRIVDLGNGHYPRYLPTSRCIQKSYLNKFHSCKVVDYKVYVLKLRETNDNGTTHGPLPESLRKKWLMKPISVAVACVPTSIDRLFSC